MENKTKKLLVLLGVIVVIALIIIVAAMQGKKQSGTQGTQTGQPAVTSGSEEAPTANPEATATAPVVNEVLKDATIAAPGASAITKDNKVVTLDGKQTVNNVEQTSPLAPSESGPVKKEQLPSSVIKLDISAAGFTPKEFTVKPGAAVSISITASDSFAHSLVFDDASLAAIGIGVYAHETRVISFNAPTKAGNYTFYCNVGNHRSRGETGTMIVK